VWGFFIFKGAEGRMKAKVTLLVPLEKETHAAFKLFARANRTSMAQIVRGIVCELLREHGVEIADPAIPTPEVADSELRTAVGKTL
jgi:hypothetical protein